jgi:hypothetical protein
LVAELTGGNFGHGPTGAAPMSREKEPKSTVAIPEL